MPTRYPLACRASAGDGGLLAAWRSDCPLVAGGTVRPWLSRSVAQRRFHTGADACTDASHVHEAPRALPAPVQDQREGEVRQTPVAIVLICAQDRAQEVPRVEVGRPAPVSEADDVTLQRRAEKHRQVITALATPRRRCPRPEPTVRGASGRWWSMRRSAAEASAVALRATRKGRRLAPRDPTATAGRRAVTRKARRSGW